MASQRIISVANLNRYADSILTPDEEMAFAILLWKFVRSTFYADMGKITDLINTNLEVATKAIEMAKAANCLPAFMNLNSKVQLLNLTIKDVEYLASLPLVRDSRCSGKRKKNKSKKN